MQSEMTAVRELEVLAMNAWPAEIIQTVEGWRLRFTQGVSRRANSAWSNESTGETPLIDRIVNAEAFYTARGAESCFHISPLSPSDLGSALADRGYYQNGDTCVQSAALEKVLAATSPSAGTELHPNPTASWVEVAWPKPELQPAIRRGILRRIGPQMVCVLAHEEGRAVAAGFGVFERAHVGIFSMRTQEAARGRGLASAVLHALASWGLELDAQTAYLQVEEDNSALRLYARAGFQTVYGYHYRSRATQ